MYGNSTSIGHNGKLIWQNQAKKGFFFTKLFDDAILLQTLEIRSSYGLAICELKLIEGGKALVKFKAYRYTSTGCSFGILILPSPFPQHAAIISCQLLKIHSVIFEMIISFEG